MTNLSQSYDTKHSASDDIEVLNCLTVMLGEVVQSTIEGAGPGYEHLLAIRAFAPALMRFYGRVSSCCSEASKKEIADLSDPLDMALTLLTVYEGFLTVKAMRNGGEQ